MPARLPEGMKESVTATMDCMIAEIIELRAELEKIKQQEPVIWWDGDTFSVQDGFSHYETKTYKHPLFLAPGAQPVPEGMVLVPLQALKAIKRGLMHQRRFGSESLNAWRSSATDAEAGIEAMLEAAKETK